MERLSGQVDWFNDIGEPHCPHDSKVLIAQFGAYICRGCGYTDLIEHVLRPAYGPRTIDLTRRAP